MDISFIKNWGAKEIVSLITFATTLIGGAFLIDERYAHAGEVGRKMTVLTDQLEINRLSSEISILRMRKASLEDKLYESNARNASRASKSEAKIQDRYTNELEEVTRQIVDKEQLLDTIKNRITQNQVR